MCQAAACLARGRAIYVDEPSVVRQGRYPPPGVAAKQPSAALFGCVIKPRCGYEARASHPGVMQHLRESDHIGRVKSPVGAAPRVHFCSVGERGEVGARLVESNGSAAATKTASGSRNSDATVGVSAVEFEAGSSDSPPAV